MSTSNQSREEMVSAVFRDRARADDAFDMLRDRGYGDPDINVLMSDKTRALYIGEGGGSPEHRSGSMATEGMGVGGAVGTALGATLAAIAAVGTTLAIPGLGLVVAGPLAAAFAGAGAGAAAGGLLGGLIGLGITESNAAAYEEALKNGGVVIGVRPRNGADRDAIKKEFESLGGENVVCC